MRDEIHPISHLPSNISRQPINRQSIATTAKLIKGTNIMSLKKDKQKVLGEFFDDERIKTFLELEAPAGVEADFHLLEKAYRGMGAENFATFVKFFVEAGRNLDTVGPEGKNILQICREHRHSAEYVAALEAAGAK
jgi:hypothetical protein